MKKGRFRLTHFHRTMQMSFVRQIHMLIRYMHIKNNKINTLTASKIFYNKQKQLHYIYLQTSQSGKYYGKKVCNMHENFTRVWPFSAADFGAKNK